jgi:hypothetical protein
LGKYTPKPLDKFPYMGYNTNIEKNKKTKKEETK